MHFSAFNDEIDTNSARKLNAAISSISFQVSSSKDGIWGLRIAKVGHEDAGVYECQTNSEVKGSVKVNLNVVGKRTNKHTNKQTDKEKEQDR